MTGTLVNAATVVVGSLLGVWFRGRLSQNIVKTVFQGIGLFTLYLGFSMSIKGTAMLTIVFSVILGAITGQWLQIDRQIERVANCLKHHLRIRDDRFSEGFITAFLLFCIGSMTILGAFEEGMGRGSQILLTKALMDGFAAIALASALGYGVGFSALPLLLYQGGLTLLAWWLGHIVPTEGIDNLTSVGGILIIGLGINILELKKINVTNMLPALLWIFPLLWLGKHLQRFFDQLIIP